MYQRAKRLIYQNNHAILAITVLSMAQLSLSNFEMGDLKPN